MKFVRTGILLLVVALLPAPASAQGVGNKTPPDTVVVGQPATSPPPPDAPAYGITAETVIVIGGSNMRPPSSTVGYATFDSATTGIGLYQTTTTSSPDWWHSFQVPSGALLTRVIVEACDTTSTGTLSFGISRANFGGSFTNIATTVETGTVATPGCAFFTITPSTTVQVNNETQNYWFFTAWLGSGTAFSSALRLQSIRVYYRLQVSPAPATAAFADVPVGHPFHRFIEALVAAGVTSGCGGGNYCPDAPVTRGQMAVFLSVALGLHFPN